MEFRADLMDAHLYAFKRFEALSITQSILYFVLLLCSHLSLVRNRSALQQVLTEKPNFHSIKQDVLSYLVRSQLVGL